LKRRNYVPFIKIATLPNTLDKAKIMQGVEEALYKAKYKERELMPRNMATCIWQTHDCVVHKLKPYTIFDPKLEEIPVFVDLYVNTIFGSGEVALIMETVAKALSDGTGVDLKWIFIQVHVGAMGYVFINGKVSGGEA
jgi:hypothetical protein